MTKVQLIYLVRTFLVLGIVFGSLSLVQSAECGVTPTNGCTISQSTTFNTGSYHLTQSVNITASNIVIIGNGSTFFYNENNLSSVYGFYSQSVNNITLSNISIVKKTNETSRFDHALSLNNVTNFFITYANFSLPFANSSNGIYAQNSRLINISNSRFEVGYNPNKSFQANALKLDQVNISYIGNNLINVTGYQSYGMYIYNSSNSIVRLNTFHINSIDGWGIHPEWHSNFNVVDSNIFYMRTYGTIGVIAILFELDSRNNTATNNTVIGTTELVWGVSSDSGSDGNIIRNNNITLNGNFSRGIAVIDSQSGNFGYNGSKYNTIEYNSIRVLDPITSFGITLTTENSTYNTIAHNFIEANGTSLNINSFNNTIFNNTILTSGTGILVSYGGNNISSNNITYLTITSSVVGINILSSSGNNISNNLISAIGTGARAMRISSSTGDLIDGGRITALGSAVEPSTSTGTITFNNFIVNHTSGNAFYSNRGGWNLIFNNVTVYDQTSTAFSIFVDVGAILQSNITLINTTFTSTNPIRVVQNASINIFMQDYGIDFKNISGGGLHILGNKALKIQNINSTSSNVWQTYGLTNSLIFSSNNSIFCSNVPSCNGNINVTLQQIENATILDNFNLTEGVSRQFSPIWFSSSTNEDKFVSTNLSQDINTMVTLNVLDSSRVNRVRVTQPSGAVTTYKPSQYTSTDTTITLQSVTIGTGGNTEFLLSLVGTCDAGTINITLLAGALLIITPFLLIFMKVKDSGFDPETIREHFNLQVMLMLFIAIIIGVAMLVISANNAAICPTS